VGVSRAEYILAFLKAYASSLKRFVHAHGLGKIVHS
jgi:hypothetical protein